MLRNTSRVAILVVIVGALLALTNGFWEGKLLGLFSVLMSCSVIFIALVISLENRKPAQTIAWLAVLGSFPIVGFLFYLLFGRNYWQQRRYKKKADFDEAVLLKFQEPSPIAVERLPMAPHQRPLLRLAYRIGQHPVSLASQTAVLTNGEETFSSIFAELEKRGTPYSFRILYRPS